MKSREGDLQGNLSTAFVEADEFHTCPGVSPSIGIRELPRRGNVAQTIGHQHRQWLAKHLRGGISKNVLGSAVDKEYAAFVVDHEQGTRGLLGDVAIPPLDLA